MKNYKVTFCWATKLPTKLVVRGEETNLLTNTVILKGEDTLDMLNSLKGTDTKLISCINTIKEC